MTNLPLLKAAFEVIKQHPEAWEQKQWRCNTGLCFAGWVVVLDGGIWSQSVVKGLNEDGTPKVDSNMLIATVDDFRNDRYDCITAHGVSHVSAETRAKRLLNLPYGSSNLFSGRNTFEELEGQVKKAILDSVDLYNYKHMLLEGTPITYETIYDSIDTGRYDVPDDLSTFFADCPTDVNGNVVVAA